MAAPKKKSRKGNVYTFDFTGVKSGGSAPPEGRYKAKIISVEEKEGQESGEPYSELTWEITSDKCNGREIRFDNYSHQPQALWRIKSLFTAMGIDITDGDQEVDFDSLVDDETECIVELTHEKRENGTYARVTGWDTVDSGNTVDDEDGEDPKDKKRGTASRSGGSASRNKRDESDDDDDPPQRRGRKQDDDDDGGKRSSNKKLKKGAAVVFKNEKNKRTEGVISSIDGDKFVVDVLDDDGEVSDSYELDAEDLTPA